MPNMIDFADVAPPEVWQTSRREASHDRELYPKVDEYVSAKEGLSFFNIPSQILLGANADRFFIRMKYPDGEPGEKAFESVPHRSDLRLRLGVHTKKIVEIEIDNLHRFLLLENGRLPVESIAALAAEYPSRIQKVLTRNARLIGALLASLSEPMRSRIHQTLAAAQRDLKMER